MPVSTELPAPALDDIQGQVAFYCANSFVPLPNLLMPEPEPADGEILHDHAAHLARGGAVYFHGTAGSAILWQTEPL